MATLPDDGPDSESEARLLREIEYFASYADLSVHETMLRDEPRTQAYRQALESLRAHVEGKCVLDVGTGTGVLAMMAAKAGARKVIAVEASPLADVTRQIVADNKLDDVVQVVHSRVEDLKLAEPVDVIVSEWMGFYLVHESMLESVIFARDHFLKPGGLLLPSRASILAAPVDLTSFVARRTAFWRKPLYGFNMQAAVPAAVERVFAKNPMVAQLDADAPLADAQELVALDLHTVTAEELRSFAAIAEFTVSKPGTFHGFALWFNVDFAPPPATAPERTPPSPHPEPEPRAGDGCVRLGTGPADAPTHWQQTVIVLSSEGLAVSAGLALRANLSFAQEPEAPRLYVVDVEIV